MIETCKLAFHVTRRNWLVYRKNFVSNIAPTIVEPLFLMLSLGVGLGAFIQELEGRSYTLFLAPGLVASAALFTSFFECSYGFFVRMRFENIYTAMLTTPIGVREVILGEFFWVALKGGFMCLLVTFVFVVLGTPMNPFFLPLIFLLGALLALACGSLGLIAASYVRNIDQFQTVYAFIIAPLFYFSGIFFPIQKMPQGLQWLAETLPLSQGILMARSVYWNENVLQVFGKHGAILGLQIAVIGTFAYHRVFRKLQN